MKAITVTYVPKPKLVAEVPTDVRRYFATLSVKPDYEAKVNLRSEFPSPFIMVSMVCDEPSARFHIGETCSNAVPITVTAETSCTAKLCVELRDQSIADEVL